MIAADEVGINEFASIAVVSYRAFAMALRTTECLMAGTGRISDMLF